MPIPTASDLTYLRQQPHHSDLYLSIYKPPTVWAAQVNDATIAKGARIITFNNVTTSGSPVRGQTMYVGTTPGGKDKGTTFVMKPISGSTITVAENKHIDWADDLYLTVVNFFQIWPKYPRVTLTTGTSQINVYTNYDEGYITGSTQQNNKALFMANMGSHYAGFLDIATQKKNVYFTGLNIQGFYPNVIEEVSGTAYLWSFEGGIPTGSTAQIPGNITYDTPGFYTASLKVSFLQGGYTGTFYAYRHISIYDRPGEGPDIPITKWGLESLSGSRDESGYTAKLWVEQDISDIVDGALVVIFSDDWYGTTKTNLTGNTSYIYENAGGSTVTYYNLNRPGIVFVGYIIGDTIQYDYQRSRVTFSVGSPTVIMKKGETFAVSLAYTTYSDPYYEANVMGGSPWYYLSTLNLGRGLCHYIYYYTTLNLCADFIFRGVENPTYLVSGNNFNYFDANRTSISDVLQNSVRNMWAGDVVSDSQGVIWAERDLRVSLNTVYPTIMLLDKMDWINQPKITESQDQPISQLEVGGVSFDGLNNTPYLAVAPGATPAYRGTSRKMSGLVLTSQSELNSLAGNIYAMLNARYPEVDIQIAGNYRCLDIAPTHVVFLTVLTTDNNKGISWVNKKFIIQNINWMYNNNLLRPDITLTEFTSGTAGETVVL